MKAKILFASLIVISVSILGVVSINAQGPSGGRSPYGGGGGGPSYAFTYQGQLKNNGAAVNGACDFQFGLWGSSSGGAQVSGTTTQTLTSVTVTNGLFTTPIDFGASAFNGDPRYLQVAVGCPAPAGTFAAMTTRQALTPAPMAYSLPGLYTTQNITSPNVIGGYSGNVVSPTVYGATIGGGGLFGLVNTANNSFVTIGGGGGNTASGPAATIGGGGSNTASGSSAIIGGGSGNSASGDSTTIGGGSSNSATAQFATVGGGANNHATQIDATVSGGNSNNASFYFATVSGGQSNTASGNSATVGGGSSNTAGGDNSFVAGHRAKDSAFHDGVFMFADSNDFDFSSTASNQFRVRSTGGAQFVSAIDGSGNPTAGVNLVSGGGSWSSLSDRNVKANFAEVNSREILARVVALPVQTWNYSSQAATIRHIGPMAQDFYAAFNVGEDDTHITTIDSEGVALAAIQGLNQIVQEQETQVASLKTQVSGLTSQVAMLQSQNDAQQKEIAVLKQQNATMEARLTALEQLAQTNGVGAHTDSTNGVMIVVGMVLGMVVIVRRPWRTGGE